MFYERQDLSPPNEKEKRFTECEYCCGDGWVYHEYDGSSSQSQLDCPKCHGEGQIEIED